ncbi:methylamine utilization protein [Sphingomonas kaistensis]|uniref:Methylamine utilization protein n=1 Tax=Sphingomonas kaistensis TaxID=298708 RepID=A0ABZ2FZ49_9SPHN
MRLPVIAGFALLNLPGNVAAATLNVVVVDAAGRPVQNAVVSARPLGVPASGPRFASTKVMGQRNIQFTPGTLVVPLGSTVSFPNYDKVRHHVFSFSKAKRFELKLFGRDESRSVLLDKPGTVAVGCNIHDAMRGFIRVVDAPFAGTSDAAGRLSLAGTPAGRFQLTVWHPQVRARDQEVTVIGSASAPVVIRLPLSR